MEYIMKGGTVYTDEDFDRLAAAAERGDYPGTPGAWVVRPQGRPSLCDEELVTIACKIPRSKRDAIDRRAKAAGKNRSDFIRSALEKALV